MWVHPHVPIHTDHNQLLKPLYRIRKKVGTKYFCRAIKNRMPKHVAHSTLNYLTAFGIVTSLIKKTVKFAFIIIEFNI